MSRYQSKTGRKYGEMTRMILSKNSPFTWKDFCPPLIRKQAAMRCRQLALAGRLKIVRESKIGRNKPLVLYQTN